MKTKLTVTFRQRGPGHHTTIVESPWAEALEVIDGLRYANNNATYRGVKFGQKRQASLRLRLDTDYLSPQWAVIRDNGRGEYEFENSHLDEILSLAAKIESLIASAVPASESYPCAERSSGCGERVRIEGDLCPRCQHDD